jgi:hypothetical protein
LKFVKLSSQLEQAVSPFDLAQRLGAVCISNGARLAHLAEQPEIEPLMRALEAQVERVDGELLAHPRRGHGYRHLLDDPDLGAAVEGIEAHSPIEHLAFLRGILPFLRTLYDGFEDRIEAKLGTPLPIAARGINRIFRPTPTLETCGINDLLHGSGFYLFEFGASETVPVVLDFRFRDRLDQLTWSDRKALPRIATIHPELGRGGLVIGEEGPSSFFDVRPRAFELEAVMQQLRKVAEEAEIALLPELSLPQVDALEKALADAPASYPALVVAGSAHHREGVEEEGRVTEVRANESRIYLDGELVGRHRKIHPFELKRAPDGEKLEHPLREAITRERKPLTILAGDFTRLGVLICADLLDKKLPLQLEDAGVNLLLVPALTPDPGGFNGGICGLASRCQGVSVVANVDSSFFEVDEPPFTVMVGVPRSPAGEQSREYQGPDRFPAISVIDPNESLPEELDWQVISRQDA